MSVMTRTYLCLRMKCCVPAEGFIMHFNIILRFRRETYYRPYSTFIPDALLHIQKEKEFDTFQLHIRTLIFAFISEMCPQ